MFSKWYEETLRNNFCLPSFDYGIIDDGNNNGLLLVCRSTKENKIETWKYNYFNKHFCLLKSDPIPFASSRTFNLLKYISKVYLNQALIIVNRKSLLYDIVNGTWINLEPAEDCDIPCYSKYAIQKYEDHIFIAIASDGSLNIYSLNLVSLSWKCLSKIDSLLYGHEIIVYKGKIYIFGGVTSKFDMHGEFYSFDNVLCFDISTKQWTSLSTYPDREHGCWPMKRIFHKMTIYNDTVCLVGGVNSSTSFLRELWTLHLPSLTWKLTLLDFPISINHYQIQVTVSGVLYVCGIDKDTNVFRMYKTHLDFAAVKLADICWDFIMNCEQFGRLQHCSDETLLDLGVPKKFIEKLRW